MKKLLLILLTATLLYGSNAILKLDTKGHTSIINDIIITNEGDIIFASDDKTIRIWDSQTGREKRKILGQIGAGSEGKIYAIALSPDNKFLAVGGFMELNAKYSDPKDANYIRIYNYKTGKLLKILKSHSDVVNDLAFSDNGKYLISGSADTTAKVWSVRQNFRLIDTINFHTDNIYGVKIIKNGGDYFAVTAGYDNRIALYNMQTKKIVKSYKLPYKLQYLATSKKHIAVCGKGREIKIYDYSLNLVKTIESETKPSGLAYSPNGKYLIAGAGDYPDYINIYSVNQNYKKIQSFKKHTNVTMAVAFLDNQTAVSGGGNNFEIYIWNIKTAQPLTKMEGVGDAVWSVGVKGDKIAWGNIDDCSGKNCSKLQKYINLKNFSISEKLKVKSEKFNRISTTYKNYSLEHRKGGNYGKSDAILDIKKNGETIASIVRDATNGIRHRCYGFYKDYIISGGAHGFLKIYNLQGDEVANLVGHTGDVWSIALDGDRLVSGGADQTIMVWDLSKLKRTMRPQLNIFVSKDNEWIIWSKGGYYNSSIGGAKHVGFHINRGSDREAYYVTADKYPQLYRADIIDHIIDGKSEREAIRLANRTKKVQKVNVASATPPILSLISPSNISTTHDKITIKFRVDTKSPLKKLIVTRNGERVTQRTVQRAKVKRITVDLEGGENIISIRAKNRFAISDELIVRATKTSADEKIYRPTLYLLSVGVSQYKDRFYNLNVADRDALGVEEAFKRQERLYRRVVTKHLINEDATRDNILDALSWIESEVTQRDVAVIFIAGHGLNDDKTNYYFLAHDSNAEMRALRRTAIKWDEIKDTITSLPSKVLLLADTCHSGNIMGDGKKRDITGAIKSIVDAGTGAIIMTATTGRGYSIEKESWGRGAFTKALLEGLNGRADFNKNREISIKELDLYITDRVKELTDGQQKPTTMIPHSIPNFAIGIR